MIQTKEAQEIYDNWTNGNRADVRAKMKRKSKLFALDLAYYIGTETRDFQSAITEVAKMVS